MDSYRFKIASEEWEFEQIKSLNYETFVEEIGQHSSNPDRQLTDAFHNENTYIICVDGRQVLAMLAVRGKRPFSLDKKLADLDSYLPPGGHLCEVRLLAVRKHVRNTRIVRGLLAETVSYCINHGYDTALISGILQQVNLYQHLGFVSFGPVVGNNGVRFQPMYLTVETHKSSKTSFLNRTGVLNLLPGPVTISEHVRQALTAPPLSHRSREYLALHKDVQHRLRELTGSKHVQILTGSGTLANEVVAGQLSLLSGTGLVLSNGEFGERLIEQAKCFNLNCEELSLPWGQGYEKNQLEEKIRQMTGLKWIWTVYSESSTGMLNDIEMLKAVAGDYGLRLCLDCVSAIGNTPLNLADIYLASGCSSKGLRSVAGLAFVFYNHSLKAPNGPLPVYLDLCRYENCDGVPFTISSNLVGALAASLRDRDFGKWFSELNEMDRQLRNRLDRLGLRPLVSGPAACPGIITIPLQKPLNSRAIGDTLRQEGFLISYESRYLLERNWIQICLMSDIVKSQLTSLADALERLCCRPLT